MVTAGMPNSAPRAAAAAGSRSASAPQVEVGEAPRRLEIGRADRAAADDADADLSIDLSSRAARLLRLGSIAVQRVRAGPVVLHGAP